MLIIYTKSNSSRAFIYTQWYNNTEADIITDQLTRKYKFLLVFTAMLLKKTD